VIEQILQADRYLQVDQVEKARDAYQKVVDLDPANAIAVVGLARCALAEGDDQEAHQLAARALEIDPENDMARRMEARLSEILATRGEPVERPGVATTPSPQDMRPVVTGAAPAVEPSAPTVTPRPAPATAAPTPDARSTSATASGPKVPPVRKSIFDRLLGR
jgi:Tfp pilus assembly protein PilF